MYELPDNPADPAAAALDLLVQFPELSGRDDPETVAGFRDLAMMIQLEGIFEGMDWNDARHAVALLGVVLIDPGPQELPARAAWIRGAGSGPLHEPERIAVAFERVYALVELPY